MLVHFIGGPAHGRSEAIQTVPPIIKMPKAVEAHIAWPPTLGPATIQLRDI